MSVKIMVTASQVPKIPSGTLLNWNEDATDFTFAAGRLKLNAIVVYGNTRTKNGQKLTLYLAAGFPTVSLAPNRQQI